MIDLIKKVLSLFYVPLKHSFEISQLKRAAQQSVVKIVIGSGNIYEKGWVPTDIHYLNVLKENDWNFFFKENAIDAILAEHVWEHLSLVDGELAAKNCYKYLKKNGYLRIAVPDGLHPMPAYIDYVKVGGTGAGADDHKVLYTYKSLSDILQKAGFTVKLLEYFNEQGQFCESAWNAKEGLIRRSKNHDPRNADGKLNYTSLMIDAVKM